MVGAGLWHPLALFTAFVLDGADLDAMLAEIHTLHTDERPVIEFEAPRALYADTTATVDPMVQTFQRKDYPSLTNFDEKELTARDIYLIGFGYASLKRPEPAIRFMEESIRRDPEGDPKFRVGLANQYRGRETSRRRASSMRAPCGGRPETRRRRLRSPLSTRKPAGPTPRSTY